MIELKEGQTVYLQPIGNAARYDKELIETKINKIGNKYFTVTEQWYGRFYIDTFYQDGKGYISNYRVILSQQQLEDEKEQSMLIERIKKYICDLPLPILREINTAYLSNLS